MARDDVIEYFSDKAEEYDDVEKQLYWNLSDDLLWHMINEEVIPDEKDSFTVLDAGGGTGRWIIKILRKYENAEGVLFDLSEDMLEEARNKVDEDIEDRIRIIQGDLEKVDSRLEEEFDVIINFHNVLGFVKNPQEIVKNLTQLMHEKSVIASFVPNKYHGIFFNTKLGNIEEAEKISSKEKGRFTEEMPEMNFFTPSQMQDMYEDCEITRIETYGLPVSIYPGFQETQEEGTSKSLEELLSNKDNYDRIKKMEKNLMKKKEAASRGNNILAIGRK